VFDVPKLIDHVESVVALGWGLTKELKEPEFDTIRGRDDFKKLLADVEARGVPKAQPHE
jgi:hypothetical protein